MLKQLFTDSLTGQPAIQHCELALSLGKHVVTTNKGPVALAVQRLTELSKKNNCGFEFEGTVMSGTPVLRYAKDLMKGCNITGFEGILNGTSNYILSKMESGEGFTDALIDAQQQGYAEADPSADIEGKDVMLKVQILANTLLGAELTLEQIQCKGITNISCDMVSDANTKGERWKLIGKAQKNEQGKIEASVKPERITKSHPLYGIGGANNAINFKTDLLGDTTIVGPGAGKTETAFALLSDIVAIHRKFSCEGE